MTGWHHKESHTMRYESYRRHVGRTRTTWKASGAKDEICSLPISVDCLVFSSLWTQWPKMTILLALMTIIRNINVEFRVLKVTSPWIFLPLKITKITKWVWHSDGKNHIFALWKLEKLIFLCESIVILASCADQWWFHLWSSSTLSSLTIVKQPKTYPRDHSVVLKFIKPWNFTILMLLVFKKNSEYLQY